jgi:hypothetical protein
LLTGYQVIEKERKRHARGMATFEMLWLLFRPGVEVLVDKYSTGEYQPYVMGSVDCDVLNGTNHSYTANLWNMKAIRNTSALALVT